MASTPPTRFRTGDTIDVPGDYHYRALTEGHPIQRFWHQEKFRILERIGHLQPDDVVLDCGCGSGVMSDFMASRCGEVVGVDCHRGCIDFATSHFQRPGLRFVHAAVEDIDYPDGYFSKVVTMEVLEHLYEQQGRLLLRRFNELLKPGGVLLLTTPNYRGLWPLVEYLADRSKKVAPMDQEQHVTRYHRKLCMDAVREAGFVDLEWGTFSTVAPFISPLSWRLAEFASTLEARLRLPFGNILYVQATKLRTP